MGSGCKLEGSSIMLPGLSPKGPICAYFSLYEKRVLRTDNIKVSRLGLGLTIIRLGFRIQGLGLQTQDSALSLGLGIGFFAYRGWKS